MYYYEARLAVRQYFYGYVYNWHRLTGTTEGTVVVSKNSCLTSLQLHKEKQKNRSILRSDFRPESFQGVNRRADVVPRDALGNSRR